MDDLLPDFIAETRETLQDVAAALVAWEADPSDRERLDAIFRFVHTVKGSCGFLDLPRLERLSHAAEDALADVRGGRRAADAQLVSAILAVIDRIGELTEALESGAAIDDADEIALVSALTAEPCPAAQAVAPASPARGRARIASRTVRLPVELLDRLMGSVSDMVLARNELAHDIGDGSVGGGAFERLSHCVGELRDAVTRARMARIDTLFAGLPRLVRDLGLELGKQVRLELDGGEVELDREMIEMIRDPLVHAVRNAIDHGIEPAPRRLAGGKGAEGLIAIRAWQSGSRILIEVVDDGAGIDTARVVEKAVAAGLVTRLEANALTPERAAELIFHPGLSTAREVTEVSGRGVGMDVVRANVERLGGTLSLDNRPGRGMRLVLEVPLTLTIIPALTVSGGGQCFAIARSTIDEIVRVSPQARLEQVGGGRLASVRGARLPVVRLTEVLGLEGDLSPAMLVILRTSAGHRFALEVEVVHDHEELVIKPAAPALLASGLFAGTTLPDSCRPMLLLDAMGLAAAAGVTPVPIQVEAAPVAQEATCPTLLFRDLDGVVRGVRLEQIDRIEEATIGQVVEAGGRRLLATGMALVPLHAVRRLDGRERVRVLRLRRGDSELGYALDQVIDVQPVAETFVRALVPGAIAGVLLHEGRPVELLDVAWLVAQAGALASGPVGVLSAGAIAA